MIAFTFHLLPDFFPGLLDIVPVAISFYLSTQWNAQCRNRPYFLLRCLYWLAKNGTRAVTLQTKPVKSCRVCPWLVQLDQLHSKLLSEFQTIWLVWSGVLLCVLTLKVRKNRFKVIFTSGEFCNVWFVKEYHSGTKLRPSACVLFTCGPNGHSLKAPVQFRYVTLTVIRTEGSFVCLHLAALSASFKVDQRRLHIDIASV
jgi:hypothetical protein